MRNNVYTVNQGLRNDPEFAWQLCSNKGHVQWFSDETVARKTCDELNAIELIKEKREQLNAMMRRDT